jgi:class 3 adenylate cyclase/tetratricopeptide (TPR) repeat protein
MQCASCQSDNPVGYKFCNQCGAALKVICPACSFSNDPGGRFCGGCGSSLETTDGTPVPPKTKNPNEAERRQLTVMFCDLVGSTALSERLDPEDLRDAITAYQETTARAIERYGGYIARFMGDGLLIYFGYPNAHERDPERAVRAGLDIITAIRGKKATDGTPFQVRIGAATGMVVAGDIIGSGASEERAVLGDTPNLAARLQGLAEPDTMVVSATTQMLCGQRLLATNLGEFDLKGIAKPVVAYSVEGIGHKQSSHLSPVAHVILTGHKGPMEGFSKLWHDAGHGHGGAMLVTGEAGIGKSCLLAAIREQVQKSAGSEIVLMGSEFHQDSALKAFQEYLLSELAVNGATSSEDRWQHLENYLGERALDPAELAPVLGHLLTLVPSEKYPLADMDGAVLKDKTADALIRVIRTQCDPGPLLLIAEDIQWMDASTREILGQILASVQSSKQVCVIAARPEFKTRDMAQYFTATYALERLGPDIARDVVNQIVGDRVLASTQIDNILEHADGVPLFLEEITRSVMEAHHEQRGESDLSIPVTLQDSLMARLDRLGSAKSIAQAAAVIGRVFRRDVLLAIVKREPADLDSALLDLVTAGLITPSTAGPSGGFEFKQTLIRDAAYQSLLISRRRDLHGSVADELKRENDAGLHSEPEVIAHHYSEAGVAERALPYWTQAAHTAAKRWANAEAVNFYKKALKSLRDIDPPDTANEVDLLLDMVASMRIIDRFDGALKALDEAQALSGADGRIDDLIRIHYLRGNMYFPLGNTEGCLKEHSEACRLARQAGKTDFEARALGGIGDAYMLRGEFALAEEKYDQCVRICRDHDLPAIETANLGMRGHSRLYLNRISEAIEDCNHAAKLAIEGGNRRAEMTTKGSVLAKILAEQGKFTEAEHQLRAALEIARNLGAIRYFPMYLSLLARIQWSTGRTEEALQSAEEALEGARKDGMVYTGAMVLGACAKVCEDQQRANQCLDEGIEIIAGGVPAHNLLWFHLDAMDTALAWKDWDRVEKHAEALETFARPRGLAWAVFHTERCRLLAKAGRGAATDEDLDTLKSLMAEARARGQQPAVDSIAGAIS